MLFRAFQLRESARGSCRSAFTLIELLVVCTVIGILVAIALSKIQRSILQAHAAQTIANMKTIQRAVEIAQASNGGSTIGVLAGGMYGFGCGALPTQDAGGTAVCPDFQPYLPVVPDNTLNVPANNGKNFVWSSETTDKWQQYPATTDGGFFFGRRFFLVMINSWAFHVDGRYCYELGQPWSGNGHRFDEDDPAFGGPWY